MIYLPWRTEPLWVIQVNYWYGSSGFGVLLNSTNSLDASVPYSYQWDVEIGHFLALCIADDSSFLEFYSTLKLYWLQSSCPCVHLDQTDIFTSAFRHSLLAENHTTFCCLPSSLPISLPSEEAKQAFPNAQQVKPAWLAHIHVHHQVKWSGCLNLNRLGDLGSLLLMEQYAGFLEDSSERWKQCCHVPEELSYSLRFSQHSHPWTQSCTPQLPCFFYICCLYFYFSCQN